MAWIKLDCLAEMRLRFRELALRLTGGAKQAPRIGMDRISLNHLSIELFSLEKSARLVMLLGLNKCLGNVGHRQSSFHARFNAAATRSFSASAKRANTSVHSLTRDCRKRRTVGYQGLSSRSNSQRQSGTSGNAIQTGTPRAPAKCGNAVSEATTKSRHFMMAAVSMNGPASLSRRSPKSITEKRSRIRCNCSVPGPFCKLMS